MSFSRICSAFLSTVVLALLSVVTLGQAQAASLTFTPSSTTFKQGCVSKIDLVVDTQGVSTNAVDALILFNSSEVQIIDQISSIPGIQLKTGNVYEIYAGNLVNESQGKIYLTAFSVIGNFNGSGLLGSIYFTSKPGVTSTTFQFQYAPGQSVDSNVADLNGNDVLSSVNSAAYTFQSSPCVADTQAPSVSQVTPANGATDVPLNSNISLHITDNQSGVNVGSVEIQVHNVVYTSTSPQLTLSGLPLDYTFTINPEADFPDATEIVMVVKATDIDGNVMSPKVFSFNRPVPPPPPPAAPPVPVCGNGIVETDEECEPANTLFCDASCKINALQCLTIDPEVLQELAQISLGGSGEVSLPPEQVAAIKTLEQLSQALGDATYLERGFMVGGATATRVVEYVTESMKSVTRNAETVVQSMGCTEDCVKVIFGENQQRWYIPFGVIVLLFVLLIFLIYKLAQKLSERSDEVVEMSQKEAVGKGKKMPKK